MGWLGRGVAVVVGGQSVEVGYDYGEADEVVDQDVGCCHGFSMVGLLRSGDDQIGSIAVIHDQVRITVSFVYGPLLRMLDTLFLMLSPETELRSYCLDKENIRHVFGR